MLFAPSGDLIRDRQMVTLPPEFAKMLAVLGETSAELDLGLHCSRCHENLVGKNAREDTQWIVECGCRTFKGGNPMRRH